MKEDEIHKLECKLKRLEDEEQFDKEQMLEEVGGKEEYLRCVLKESKGGRGFIVDRYFWVWRNLWLVPLYINKN